MKLLRDTNYRIVSKNQHFRNILEENYYIELGAIDLDKLEKLMNNQILDLSDIFYLPLASEGIGKMINSVEVDLDYQLAYLFHLRQKSSSYKIFLTCGIIKYHDKEGKELFAPSVFIPVDIDMVERKVIKSSEALPNPVIVHELQFLTGVVLPNLNHINSVEQIDAYGLDIAKKTNTKYKVGNYLTCGSVEYNDFTINEDFFDVERSVYETSDRLIRKEYFEKIKAVLPTDIYQKYILLKAHDGENFVVAGKLGAGKTYTILNIVADKIASGKKVLYVNQDMDNLTDFETNLEMLQMGPYTYNLSHFTKEFKQRTSLFKEIDFPEIIFPEIIDDNPGLLSVKPLEDYEDALNDKIHGFSYQSMICKLAVIKNTYPDIEEIPIEPDLEHFEVNDVELRLKDVENALEKIDPIKHNVWTAIENFYDSDISDEIKTATLEYNKAYLKFLDFLKKFCKQFWIKLPNNFNDAYRLVGDIRVFSLTPPPSCWADSFSFDDAHQAAINLSISEQHREELKKIYTEKVAENYQKGDIEEILETLRYTHLSGADGRFINQMLVSKDSLIKIVTEFNKHSHQLTKSKSGIKRLFAMGKIPNDIYSITQKLETLFTTNTISNKWVSSYYNDEQSHQNLNKTILPRLELILKLRNNISQYLYKPEWLKYETIKNLTKNRNFIKLIYHNIDKKLVKNDHKQLEEVGRLVVDYRAQANELITLTNQYDLINELSFEDFCDSYYSWINFIKGLTTNEKNYFNLFIKSNINEIIQNNNFFSTENNNSIKDATTTVISIFNKECYALNNLFLDMTTYGIFVEGEGTLEKVDNSDEWIKYIKRVIEKLEELRVIFKNKENLNLRDLIMVVNADRDYVNLQQLVEDREDYYQNLLGTAYKGLETDCGAIHVLIDHFDGFQNKVIDNEHLSKLLSPKYVNEFIKHYEVLHILSENVLNTYRQFSKYFFGGQSYFNECSLDECTECLRMYVDRLNQLDHVFVVLENARYFDKLGLTDLSRGIMTSKYQIGISNQYIYSTFTKYQQEIVKNHEVLLYPFNVLKWIEDYNTYERNYCTKNIMSFRVDEDNYEKKLRGKLNNIQFNDYNRIITVQDKFRQLYLANMDIFNSNLDLSLFDIVIIDDCHLSSANKYYRINECKQCIVFGDSSFKDTVSNSLFARVDSKYIIRLKKRYLRMSSRLRNDWDINNQYIYDYNHKIETNEIEGISDAARTISNYFAQNPSRKINVVLYSYLTKRLLYGELVSILSKTYPTSDCIDILNDKIRILRANVESASTATDVFFYFDDLKDFEQKKLELVFKNYSSVAGLINILYITHQNPNIEIHIKKLIKNTIGKSTIYSKEHTPITMLMSKALLKRNIESEPGFGRFDIIIKGEKNNIGIIIEGNAGKLPYSLLDDYQYYYGEYIKRGWHIFIFFIEDLIDHMEDKIDEVEQAYIISNPSIVKK